MQGRCDKHLFEAAEDTCGKCGYEYCGECLVYSFGPKKPPFCIPCAVAAAGVRSNAGIAPGPGTRDLRTLKKERRSAFRRARQAPLGTAEEELLEASLPHAVPPVLPAQY